MRRALLVVVVVCAVVALGVVFLLNRSETGGDEPQTTSAPAPDDTQAGLTPAQQAELRRIATLGYIAGSEPVPEQSGVVSHDRSATFQGPTLYTCSEESAALLIDMDGNVVHSWSYPGFKSWGRAHVYENGDLLVITEDYPHLMKLNRDSELLWEWNKAAHHDFEVQPDGTIAVLVAEEITRPYICDGKPFLSDSIILLDQNGAPIWRAPILDAFERSRSHPDWLEDHIQPGHTDPLHANSLELLDWNGRRSALVSLRNIETIAVVDLEAGRIVWAVTGPWRQQHEARFADGRVMLFDNLGLGDQSRVIEFDVNTIEIVWSYTEPGFHSKTEGAQQRLPNGNALITESDNGRIIEVTREGRIVWEYINPVTTHVDGREVILGIARAERLPADFPLAWASGRSH